ncbi:MAG: aminotransferase class I/II-fold pyridoxal phosphate-dependent enzyme [Deferribacteraceae bacterium]|jgi:histidinol-phosphate aminotransferase|nr:aminotransferase class I/II-fold pyridoxal phosphate-dependent enzyme [Deferribacteraceae bacterium]
MTTHGGDIYGRASDILDFSSNTNFLGLPDGVKIALIDNIDSYDKYPDPASTALKAAIAEYHNIPSSYIVCGAGAADLIYRIVLAVQAKMRDDAEQARLNGNRYGYVGAASFLAPTFSEYEDAHQLLDSCCEYHYLSPDNGFKLDKPLDNELVFICNPNNPTGRLTELDIIKQSAKTSDLLVVDECFMDFVPDSTGYSMVPYLKDYPKAIVLRAFTKTYAMAGLRLGYCLCSNSELVQRIERTLQPWSVSTPATVAGIAALKETEYLRKTHELIPQNRMMLINGLRALGLTVYDSDTNYILFRYKAGLKELLLEHGILIRSCANFRGLDDTYYRAVVSSEANNRQLISAMEIIIANSQS